MDHSSGSSTVRRGDWSANHSGSSEPTRVAAVRRHRTRDRIVQRDRLRVAVRDDDCGGQLAAEVSGAVVSSTATIAATRCDVRSGTPL